MSSLLDKKLNILVGVTGCIAAYKSCEVVRGLQKAGCNVKVVMTQNACQFVGKRTFEALTSSCVVDSLFECDGDFIPHVDLASWADGFVVAPATANVMAKIVCGIADDALTSCVLASHTPVILAPAMNTYMWDNPSTQANISTLKTRGVKFIEPDTGRLACGDTGAGKLASVDKIVEDTLIYIREYMKQDETFSQKPLLGKNVLITAGPTREYIDPVRYLSNPSTGKMGYSIATSCVKAGANKVFLISGPVNLDVPLGVEVINITSADEMYERAMSLVDACDVVICTAAVADFKPKHKSDIKIKKTKTSMDVLELSPNKDILLELSSNKKDSCVVAGFAAETNDVLDNAKSKLERKGCDLIIANDVSCSESTFGSDTNKVIFVEKDGYKALDVMSKKDLADKIVLHVSELLNNK